MQTLVCLFCLEEAVRSYFIMSWFFEASFCFAGMEQLPLISPEWVNLVQNKRESYPACMLASQLLTSFRLASTQMWCLQTACHWLAWEWRPWMTHETDSFTRINKILTLSSERNSYTQSHFTQSLTKVADWAANTWSTRLSNPKPHWGDNGKQQILSQVEVSGKEVHSIVQHITVLANESVSCVQVQATESWLQFPPQPWLPLKTMIFLRLCRAPLSKPSSSVTFLFALRNANTMLHFMEVLVILLEWKSQVKSVLDQWEQRQPM